MCNFQFYKIKYFNILKLIYIKEERTKRPHRGRPKQRSPNLNDGKENSKHSKIYHHKKNSPPEAAKQQNQSKNSTSNERTRSASNGNGAVIVKPELPKHGSSDGSTTSAERETKSEEYQERIRKAIEKGSEQTKLTQRPSSVTSFQSQKNLRARYWSYLFDNLHRAVDEIYTTCENDESLIECKVTIVFTLLLNLPK